MLLEVGEFGRIGLSDCHRLSSITLVAGTAGVQVPTVTSIVLSRSFIYTEEVALLKPDFCSVENTQE